MARLTALSCGALGINALALLQQQHKEEHMSISAMREVIRSKMMQIDYSLRILDEPDTLTATNDQQWSNVPNKKAAVVDCLVHATSIYNNLRTLLDVLEGEQRES